MLTSNFTRCEPKRVIVERGESLVDRILLEWCFHFMSMTYIKFIDFFFH